MTSKKSPLEAVLERKCVEHASDLGWLTVKLDKAARGWPDRMFIGPVGEILFVEFKREGYRPRGNQKRVHDKLKERNHVVSIIDKYVDFEYLIAHEAHRIWDKKKKS